jgi:hypothetical protein
VAISRDDQYVIEAYQQHILLRSLKHKEVVAKYEGHQSTITSLKFDSSGNSHVFVSAGNNECLVWNPKEEILTYSEDNEEVNTVSAPTKILDTQSADNITSIDIKGFSSNIFSVTAQTETSINIFLVKVTNKKTTE